MSPNCLLQTSTLLWSAPTKLHSLWPSATFTMSSSLAPNIDLEVVFFCLFVWVFCCCCLFLEGYKALKIFILYWFKLVLEKAEEAEIKLPTSTGSLKKQESSRKTSISALLTMPKPLTVWITINCRKF